MSDDKCLQLFIGYKLIYASLNCKMCPSLGTLAGSVMLETLKLSPSRNLIDVKQIKTKTKTDTSQTFLGKLGINVS